jgi:MFS family permease
MHCLEGGFYMAGLAFIQSETVLPSFVKQLGGSDSLVAQVPVLLTAAFPVFGLFVAPLIERMARLQPYVVSFGVLQRLPYLIAALLMFFLPQPSNSMLLAIVVLAPVASGLVGGMATNAWMEMVTRMIPPHLRASGWAIRYTIQGVVGLAAGVVVQWVLTHHAGAQGYAWLHLISFGFLVCSWIAQSRMKEESRPLPAKPGPHQSYGEYLRGLPGMLLSQPLLRRYVVMRFFGTGFLMLVGQLTVHALQITQRPDADKGMLLTASMIGSLLGNLFAGLRGNRHGGRIVMIFSRVICIGLCFALPFVASFWGFLVLFFFWGFGRFVDLVGDLTFSAELCPENRRPTYLAILASCQSIALLTAASLSGWVFRLTQNMNAVALLSACFAMVSLFLLRFLPEVRGKEGEPHASPAMGESPPLG